jgi:hypothetical protein
MTIRQAFDAEMDEVQVSDNLAGKLLADRGLLDTASYDANLHEKPLDIAVASALTKVLARPSVSEGGYSVKWEAAALKARIAAIYAKWNMANPDIPKVRVYHR